MNIKKSICMFTDNAVYLDEYIIQLSVGSNLICEFGVWDF